MKRVILLQLLLAPIILFAQNMTELKGVVRKVKADTLVVAKAHKDLRYNGEEIPVYEGEEFEYALQHDHIEEYSLVFKSELKNGMWKPITFFPNGKTIQFELYPSKEFHKNEITGDSLGERKLAYQSDFSQSFAVVGNEIYGEISTLNEGSEDFDRLKVRLDSLNTAALKFHYEYFLNDKSILALNEYVNLLERADQMMIEQSIFEKYQSYYLRKNGDHPLVERANNLFNSLSGVKEGSLFIDITLETKNIDKLKLSDLSKEKRYTLLDLWSPWCSPCIRKSISLRDNYSIISKSCKIVGVAGGINTIDKAEKVIHKFAYPWKNYFEISDKNRIWEKYGISNSGGAQFLINEYGTIVAVNPTIDELLNILSEN